jgi:hypothetical protein
MQPHQNQEQPHYVQPNQPHYLQAGQSEAAVRAATQKGQRDIAFGVVWLVIGFLITAITYSSDMPVYVVAWGPALYGIIKIIIGVVRLSRH